MSQDTSKNEPGKAPPSHTARGPFAWVKPAFKSRRTMKTWIRCCIAFAATATLLVATKTSNTMGQAAFFCLIVAVIVPPTLALSIYLSAGLSLLLGMVIGWAWGNAAMAAALAVRSQELILQQRQKLAALIDPNQSVSLQTRVFTFHGHFLDPRSSAVYGVFIFFGAFGLGAIRAYFPNLTILTVFALIVMDVICATGPLLPSSNYTGLAKLFLIPAAFYVAIAIASLVLIFPESLSHVWITSLWEGFWNPVLDILRLQSETLSLKPSDTNKWAEVNARGFELREILVHGLGEVTSQMKFMDMDTSVGRLSPSDLRTINGELKSIMFYTSGLHAFSNFVNDTNIREANEVHSTTAQPNSGTQTPRAPNLYQVFLSKTKERELKHGHDLDSLVPILQAASTDVRAAAESTLLCIIGWFQDCNSHRLTGLFQRKDPAKIQQRQQMLADQLDTLVAALEKFRRVERARLIKPYERFFDPGTRQLALKDADMFASRSLYISFVFIATLDAFVERIVEVLKMIIDIDAARPTVRVWFAGPATSFIETIVGNDFHGLENPFGIGISQDPSSFDTTNHYGNDSDSSSDEGEKEKDEKRAKKGRRKKVPNKRDPDALPPKTITGRVLYKTAPFFRFFKSPQGFLALRSGIVSVAMWVPAVCPQTAWFYYDNKGIWALIMAQTGLAMYAGNQIGGFIVRFSGTVLGLLIGMTVWYIGAGLGRGSHSGVVIATTVAIAPLLLAHIAAPHSQTPFWVMTAVTSVLVIGYSWVNSHQLILANIGVGVAVGWKRALLVIIGFTAAFIIMLFPNFMSSRVLVRKTLAAIGGEVGNIFAVEIEAFLEEDARGASDDDQSSSAKSLKQKEKRTRKIEERLFAVAKRLHFIKPSFPTARFEPQISGTWPHDLYLQLFAAQVRMLGALGILIISFSKLDEKWCRVLIHKSAYLNPNFLSDVFMTITILSEALKNGHHLPLQLPWLRDRLIYHEYHSGGRILSNILVQEPALRPDLTGAKEKLSHTVVEAEVAGIHSESEDESSRKTPDPVHAFESDVGFEFDQLKLDVLFNEQLPIYCTAIVAFSSLISRIDEMADIVRELCGEANFKGHETFRRDYLDREERTIGSTSFRFSGH